MAGTDDVTVAAGLVAGAGVPGAGMGATLSAALSLVGLGDEVKFTTMWMEGLSPIDGSTVLPAQQLQFMPDTLSDTLEVGWTDKALPGASASLQQWGGNGGRTWSFEIVMFKYMRKVESFSLTGKIFKSDPESDWNERFNVDIAYMIKWLRAFCMPSYNDEAGFTVAASPPLVHMTVPGLMLADDGADSVMGVMKTCDVTYNKTFPDGEPRLVTVSLAIKEVVQKKQGDPIVMIGQKVMKAGMDAAEAKWSGNIFGKP